jgi:hypothetical protein
MTKSKGILKRFTTEEDQYIIDHFESQTLDEMALNLGRAMGSVAGRCRKFKLKLSTEIWEQRKMICIRAALKYGENTRFKKGQTSWNKGSKGLTNSNKTSFKKGNLPHNTKHDGYITLREMSGKTKSKRPYFWISLEKGKWDLLHRYIWRLYYGQIPRGANVQFKDGNSLNCKIENLELVSKPENMQRNTIRNLPADMREIIILNRQINKIIKEYEQGYVARP